MGVLAGAAVAAALLAQVSAPKPARLNGNWQNYGRDPGGQRYSPLTQITRANIGRLGVAWVYDTGMRDRSYQATPLVVNGVMYVTTPTEQVVALVGSNGRQLWKFDPQESRVRVNRGVAYWPGDAQHSPRIVLATSGDGRLLELDAKTGELVPSFGDQGAVLVREGLAPKDEPGGYGFTSPPAIFRDLIIVAPDLQEGPSHGLPGTVSAYNAVTGKLAWRFYLAPRPGETGAVTWGPGGTVNRSGPAAWDGITVDPQQGLVFVNTANPADSYYGADRPGNDLFANSLVVLEAETGKLRWYFQTVHHDTTDTDMAGPPLLIPGAGPTDVPAVATISKQALLFVLDRADGKPLFGVKEKPVTPSDVPGEHSSPTQPFPLLPPPLALQQASIADVTTVTPASEAYCRQQFAQYKNFGPYSPFQLEPTVKFPSSIGGPNWGGMSYDPALGYIIVNSSDLGNKGQMFPSNHMPTRPGRRGPARSGAPVGFEGAMDGGGRGPTRRPREVMPYRNPDVGQRFVDTQGYPCQQPPWGTLTAVSARTGRIAWQVRLGEYPELTAQGVPLTGTPNIGGSMVTAAGLVFIGATADGDFRAFDAKSGRTLWKFPLPGYGLATPMTYLGSDGNQYVAVATGGPGSLRGVHDELGSSPNEIVVFRLGGRVAVTRPSAPPAAVAASPVAAAGELPPGQGRALVLRSCTSCHDVNTVTNVHQDADAWNATVNEMVGRGATLTQDEIATVVRYLAEHYGRYPKS